MPGTSFTAQNINDRSGSIAGVLDLQFAQIQRFVGFLNRVAGGPITTVANATAAIAALQTVAILPQGGMSATDATAVVNAYVRLAQLTAIYNGNAALAVAHDFSADVDTLSGIGV